MSDAERITRLEHECTILAVMLGLCVGHMEQNHQGLARLELMQASNHMLKPGESRIAI